MTEIKRENTSFPRDGVFKLSDKLSVNMFSGELIDVFSGKTVHVRGVQLGTLLFLASRPNETVTYDMLSDAVWSDGDYAGTRVWVTVSHLKDKLFGLELDYSPIASFRGVGYSFSTSPPEPSPNNDARRLFRQRSNK